MHATGVLSHPPPSPLLTRPPTCSPSPKANTAAVRPPGPAHRFRALADSFLSLGFGPTLDALRREVAISSLAGGTMGSLWKAPASSAGTLVVRRAGATCASSPAVSGFPAPCVLVMSSACRFRHGGQACAAGLELNRSLGSGAVPARREGLRSRGPGMAATGRCLDLVHDYATKWIMQEEIHIKIKRRATQYAAGVA